MKEQMLFCTNIFDSLRKSVSDFMQAKDHRYSISAAYGNKNFGKTAIKRKITMLRQELLNLERMIDNG